MLDVTTNQNINSGFASTSIDDDDMDPLFDNDWLHEHNLDILFDLFEEEVERKGMDTSDSANGFSYQHGAAPTHQHHYHHTAATNSSTIFGTSPVTSCLFGTSPSLASALDLYDLLCLDSQQQPMSSQAATTTTTTATTNNSCNGGSGSSSSTTNSSANIQANNRLDTSNFINNNGCCSNSQQVSQPNLSTNQLAYSITNAMKIKRGLKKGRSEGISLLARPLTSNNSSVGCNNINIKQQSPGNSSSSNKSFINKTSDISIKDKNYSDKTSTKQLTNLKKTITVNKSGGSSGSIDINYTRKQQQGHYNRNTNNKHLHHYHHHAHYITGCAVIREHAYAVRGH